VAKMKDFLKKASDMYKDDGEMWKHLSICSLM
jgi:hypothetical protein